MSSEGKGLHLCLHFLVAQSASGLLRCIRFAARFNYIVDLEIVQCFLPPSLRVPELLTKDKRVFGTAESEARRKGTDEKPEIEQARTDFRHGFLDKVSQERFGIEVDKMIRGE